MKKITIPHPVKLANLADGKPIVNQSGDPAETKFSDFVMAMLGDKKFSADFKAILCATRIWQLVENAEPGSVIGLEEADYEQLKATVEKPSAGYGTTMVVMQQLPFMQAIMGAE